MMWWQAWGTPMQIRERFMVTCPCCKGVTYLLLYDEHRGGPPMPVLCCHCDGEGEVEAEVEGDTI